jgi:hypothetical protein
MAAMPDTPAADLPDGLLGMIPGRLERQNEEITRTLPELGASVICAERLHDKVFTLRRALIEGCTLPPDDLLSLCSPGAKPLDLASARSLISRLITPMASPISASLSLRLNPIAADLRGEVTEQVAASVQGGDDPASGVRDQSAPVRDMLADAVRAFVASYCRRLVDQIGQPGWPDQHLAGIHELADALHWHLVGREARKA